VLENAPLVLFALGPDGIVTICQGSGLLGISPETAGAVVGQSVYEVFANVPQVQRLVRSALEGHTVAVEPWEAGVAWAYELDWDPLPVFQNYSAYTSELDRLNAAAAESPDGPERILRENQLLVLPEFPTPDLDGRYPGWAPREQARAVLCNFAPLHTTERWQVLGRVPDRCGPPRMIGSVQSRYGEVVEVPSPGPGEVVFARIQGAEVGGLERLTALITAGIRSGAFPAEIDPGIAIAMLKSALMPRIVSDLRRDHTPQQIADGFMNLFCENLRRYVSGEPLLNVVDRARGY